jgi:hypothetical protein
VSETSWRQLAPGVYVDGDDTLHLVLDELCKEAGYEPTEENMARLGLEASRIASEAYGKGVMFDADAGVMAALVAKMPAFAKELAAREASRERHPSRLPLSKCPSCGYEMDDYTGFGPQPPSEGDFGVCAICGEMLTYQKDLTVRRISNAEIMTLCREEPDTATALWSMSGAIIRRGGR